MTLYIKYSRKGPVCAWLDDPASPSGTPTPLRGGTQCRANQRRPVAIFCMHAAVFRIVFVRQAFERMCSIF